MKDYESIGVAVVEAINGDKEAFGFLYKASYRDKYRIALWYMRNDADAEDVLEEAYVTAWKKLDTLKEPERFPAWFSQIVAHTAINALNKKKPLLFQTDEDENHITNTIEDEHVDVQPEMSYTAKERTQIIESMLDALSEEQRVCIVMYYMEEMTAPEIAELLGCPVSTVKSRLKYAKDNLYRQAEELQKKGYNFYGMAPIPFFIYLLDLEAKESAIGALTATGAGAAFSLTKIGGIIAAVGLTTGVLFISVSDNTPVTPTPQPAVTVATQTPKATSVPDESDEITEIHPDQLPELIAGGHTKEDLERLLLFAPERLKGKMTEDAISEMVRGGLLVFEESELPPLIRKLAPDYDPAASSTIKCDVINTFIQAITDYQLGGMNTTLPGLPVVGDSVYIGGNSVGRQYVDGKPVVWKKCRIKKITRQGDSMTIEYVRSGNREVVRKGSYLEGKRIRREQTAELGKLPNGTFRILRIRD